MAEFFARGRYSDALTAYSEQIDAIDAAAAASSSLGQSIVSVSSAMTVTLLLNRATTYQAMELHRKSIKDCDAAIEAASAGTGGPRP